MTDTKTLVLEMSKGPERRLTIPADWVITFGPVAIGQKYSPHDGSANVLRLYEDASKKQLKAVFKDVRAFFEEGIQIVERRTATKKKTYNQFNEQTGKMEAYQAEVKRKTWVDPYADDEENNDDFDNFDVTPVSMQVGYTGDSNF
jgi:hypothetical protein